MEQPPPSQVPNPYTVVHDSPKPASIKVFGILHIVFGAMGFVSGGVGALFWIFASRIPLANEFERSINTQYSEGYTTLVLTSSCFYFLVSSFQIACGVGLLKEKRWGHTGSLGYAIVTILYLIAYTISTIMMSNGPFIVITIAGSLTGALVALIYPICILIFLTRPNVVEALKE